MANSYTETLAEFAAKTRFEDLPAKAVEDTKRLILDTIACSVGSHYTDAGKVVVEVGRLRGGTPESTVLVTGEKTSCGNAAYVNSYLANLMDFDDIMCHAGGHFAQCAVLPALAMAERQGASGRDMITAVAVGFELTTRVGLALTRNSRINPETGKMDLAATAGQTWAVFAAAGACGKLLGFDGVKMADAMGVAAYAAPIPTIGKWAANRGAATQAGGLPLAKYTNYGALAEAGVMGALLANAGFTGDRTVLDGERGFWRIVGGGGFDFDKLVQGLGQTWNVSETSLKPYPAGRELHQPLGLFEKLMRDNRLKTSDIEELNVGILAYLAGHMGVFAVRNQIDTQMCLPYELAMAALGYPPGPEWQNPARFQDPEVLEFVKKIKVSAFPEGEEVVKREQASGEWKGCRPCKVSIKARGRIYEGEAKYAPGDPWFEEYRMSNETLAQKFRNLAVGLLRTDRIEQAIELAYGLERLDRVEPLVGCLI